MTPEEVRQQYMAIEQQYANITVDAWELIKTANEYRQTLIDNLQKKLCKHPDEYVAGDYSGDRWISCPDCKATNYKLPPPPDYSKYKLENMSQNYQDIVNQLGMGLSSKDA